MLMSARSTSLAAVCLQSTILAIVLHVAQARGHTFKASSAVLLTEVGKCILSLGLSFFDVWSEQSAARRLNVHALPSPELYSLADEVQAVGLYSESPLDHASPSTDRTPTPPRRHLRRRSNFSSSAPAFIISSDQIPTILIIDEKARIASENQAVLSCFAWPSSPVLLDAFEKAGVIPGQPLPVSVLRTLQGDILGKGWWKMGVPAVLFAVQNNLIYVAARHLSVPAFTVSFQAKTIVTAVAAVLMLNRRLGLHQWIALVFLAIGVGTMQVGSVPSAHSHHSIFAEPQDMNQILGFTSVLISCVSSAIGATYFELVIKRRPSSDGISSYTFAGPARERPASLWIRNVQLSAFSIIVGGIVVLSQIGWKHLSNPILIGDLDGAINMIMSTSSGGFFSGFDWLTWVVVALQVVGGLITALAIKYADNISKGFALSISICLSFLLSIRLFDFHVTLAPLAGITLVVGSTLLFESDSTTLLGYFDQQRRYSVDYHAVSSPFQTSISSSYSSSSKLIFRLWHLSLAIFVALVILLSVVPRSSVVPSSWIFHGVRAPSIAILNMDSINEIMVDAAIDCKWGVRPKRSRMLDPYGTHPSQQRDFPYHVSNTDQYALDDILTTRMIDYPLTISPVNPNNELADFIFLPILGQIYSNAWNCDSPKLQDGNSQTTAVIREVVRAVGNSTYPRIILPVATLRSNLERELFTPDMMDEMKDSVIVLSIENALKTNEERMKYTIDVPYPTRFHFAEQWSSRLEFPPMDDFFLNQDRPYLMSYAGAATHPWGLSSDEKFNGFLLRSHLQQQLSSFVNSPSTQSRILFDDITNSFDGAQNLTLFQDHMTQSIFCPQPSGDSPTRRGFYDAIMLGCIPVIFRRTSYGRLFPSFPEFDTSLFTVFIDENEIIGGASLIERLEMISSEEILRKQRHIQSIARKVQWSLPSRNLWLPPSSLSKTALGNVAKWDATTAREAKEGPISLDAFGLILKELSTIKSGKWQARPAEDMRV